MQIEQGMQVGSKENSVAQVIRILAFVGNDMRGFQQRLYAASRNGTPSMVRGQQALAERRPPLALNDGQ